MNSIPLLTGISIEYLSKILDEQVLTFKVSKLNLGENLSPANVYRLQVNTASSETKKLIYKCLPTDLEECHWAVSSGIFWRENLFYSYIVPMISSYLDSNDGYIEVSKSFKQLIPQYVHGLNNDSTDFILMEDLQKYKTPCKILGVTWKEFQLGIEAMAIFHSCTYAWLNHETESIWSSSSPEMGRFLIKSWICNGSDDEIKSNIELIKTNYQNMIQILQKQSNFTREYLKKLKRDDLSNQTYRIATQTTNATGEPGYFPVLIHGDFWCNNLLYKYNGEGTPIDVKLIDFQDVRRGNIYEDILSFVYSSTTSEFRNIHPVSNILKIYYKKFTTILSCLQTKIPTEFDIENLEANYRKNILPTFLFCTLSIPIVYGESNGVENSELEYVDKLKCNAEASPVAIQKLKELILEIVESGLI